MVKLYYSGKTNKEMVQISRHEEGDIRSKIRELGLKGKLHRWTKEEIIAELKRLYEKNGGFSVKIARLEGIKGLVEACKRHFGGFNKALIVAGIPTNYGEVPIPDINPEFAYLVGLVMGDGCVYGRHVNLGIVKEDGELVESFSRICKQLFRREPSVKEVEKFKIKNGKIHKHKPQLLARLGSVHVSSWLVANFKPSGKWVIPRLILDAPLEIQAGLLRGFFDAEGGVSKAVVAATQKNGEILKQMQKMLRNFGIKSKVRPQTKRKKYFRLAIYGLSNLEKFHNLVGFGLARKQKKLTEEVNRIKNLGS